LNLLELKQQAGIQDNPDQEGLDLFAELIVRECMACSTWVGKINTNTVEPVHTAHAINQRIKQQFGVEE
jgi:hypothetical protein